MPDKPAPGQLLHLVFGGEGTDFDKVEFKATIPAEMAANVDEARLGMMFDRRDADKDGNLTKAEFTAPMQRPQ